MLFPFISRLCFSFTKKSLFWKLIGLFIINLSVQIVHFTSLTKLKLSVNCRYTWLGSIQSYHHICESFVIRLFSVSFLSYIFDMKLTVIIVSLKYKWISTVGIHINHIDWFFWKATGWSRTHFHFGFSWNGWISLGTWTRKTLSEFFQKFGSELRPSSVEKRDC